MLLRPAFYREKPADTDSAPYDTLEKADYMKRNARKSDIDPKTFRSELERHQTYLDEHGYSVLSTAIPYPLLMNWQLPVPQSEEEEERLHELLGCEKEGVLVQIPLLVYAYACENRYGVDPEQDSERMERLMERFMDYQLLLRYLLSLHVNGLQDKIRPFDLFAVEHYDEVLDNIEEDMRSGYLPTIQSKIV